MSREYRHELMREISLSRDSHVICYMTGDRENINTRIAPDVIPVIYRHLELMPDRKKIDLLLYTRGGDVITPWRLVQLIREYTDDFCVLVPYRAYSAGTLVCLGADQVVMGRMGELGPIDPSVVNAYNPCDPVNPSAKVPVNIQDVYSYLALAREKAQIDEEYMAEVFLALAKKIHPLALGNVHRNYLLIKSLVQKLLSIKKNVPDPAGISIMMENLTEKLYAHNYLISRREAYHELDLPVEFPEPDLERLIWTLYCDFAQELKLAEPFDPRQVQDGQKLQFEVPAGVVESLYGCDYFIYSGLMEKTISNDIGQINVNITGQGWRMMD